MRIHHFTQNYSTVWFCKPIIRWMERYPMAIIYYQFTVCPRMNRYLADAINSHPVICTKPIQWMTLEISTEVVTKGFILLQTHGGTQFWFMHISEPVKVNSQKQLKFGYNSWLCGNQAKLLFYYCPHIFTEPSKLPFHMDTDAFDNHVQNRY